MASTGIRSYNAKIVTGADVLMGHTRWNNYHVARVHLNILAAFAAQAQSRRAGINTKHFMRGAVIMGEGINSVSPRVGPVVLGETFFKNGRWIFGIRCNCPPIEQQGKGTIWENAVVLERELLRLNEVLLLDHWRCFHQKITQEKSEMVLITVKFPFVKCSVMRA